jgi:hypothetical protein
LSQTDVVNGPTFDEVEAVLYSVVKELVQSAGSAQIISSSPSAPRISMYFFNKKFSGKTVVRCDPSLLRKTESPLHRISFQPPECTAFTQDSKLKVKHKVKSLSSHGCTPSLEYAVVPVQVQGLGFTCMLTTLCKWQANQKPHAQRIGDTFE